jgi:hypothetical protein
LEVGINDPASCSDEIETLEQEIGDRITERWTPVMIVLVGLLWYAKCILFSVATPCTSSKVDFINAEPPLVLLCRHGVVEGVHRRRAGAVVGGAVVAQVMAVSGVEWAIWELMGYGTERARRKAASATNAEQSTAECPTSTTVPQVMTVL